MVSVAFSCVAPVKAQITARRLTQRIAPQTAPAQPGPAAPAPVPQTGPRPIVVPLNPTSTPEEREQAARKAAEFRNQRAAEDAKAAEAAATNTVPPLVIGCSKVEIDPSQSLQTLSLSLTNTVQEPISYVAMDLVYFDEQGMRIKDWVTRRELDVPLRGKGIIELNQPAYHMPLVTRRVKVEVKEVRFADGKTWPATVH